MRGGLCQRPGGAVNRAGSVGPTPDPGAADERCGQRQQRPWPGQQGESQTGAQSESGERRPLAAPADRAPPPPGNDVGADKRMMKQTMLERRAAPREAKGREDQERNGRQQRQHRSGGAEEQGRYAQQQVSRPDHPSGIRALCSPGNDTAGAPSPARARKERRGNLVVAAPLLPAAGRFRTWCRSRPCGSGYRHSPHRRRASCARWEWTIGDGWRTRSARRRCCAQSRSFMSPLLGTTDDRHRCASA
jgi:hypothetical protein